MRIKEAAAPGGLFHCYTRNIIREGPRISGDINRHAGQPGRRTPAVS